MFWKWERKTQSKDIRMKTTYDPIRSAHRAFGLAQEARQLRERMEIAPQVEFTTAVALARHMTPETLETGRSVLDQFIRNRTEDPQRLLSVQQRLLATQFSWRVLTQELGWRGVRVVAGEMLGAFTAP